MIIIRRRKTDDGDYVYAIYFWENPNKKGLVPHKAQNIYKDKCRASTSEATTPFNNSISKISKKTMKLFQ